MSRYECRSTHRPILLLINGLYAAPGQLALFPDGNKRRPEPERNRRANKEPARIEPDDDVDTLAVGAREDLGGDVVHEMGDECLKGERVAEDRKEILEDDPLWAML